MENAINLLNSNNKIKQPAPNVSSNVSNNGENGETVKEVPKRQIQKPHVGVINLPNISKTPITDTLTLKEQENPHLIYKLSSSNKGSFSFKELSSVLIGLCGITALFGLKKK